MNSIFYHSGALGDFLTVLPAVALWKKCTNSNIDLIGKREYGELAQRRGYIDNIINIDSKKIALLFSDSCRECFQEYLSEYTHAVLFADEDSAMVQNFRLYFKGELYCHSPFPKKRVHVTDYHLQFILNSADREFTDLHLSPVCITKKDVINKNHTVMIHPGSGSSLKNWPYDRFFKVACNLRNAGFTIEWIIGPAEEQYEFLSDDFVHINKSLYELSEQMSRCALFIGNDSGIAHLAAAAGSAVLVLFGSSDPEVWAPRGSNNINVVYKKKRCSPCHLIKNKSGYKCTNECMSMITVDEITELAMQMLDK